MIVVMGATGQVGGAVLNSLTATGRRVRAISRKAQPGGADNVEWIVADALDTDALAAAFDGAQSAFVLNAAPADAPDVFAAADALSTSIAAAVDRAGLAHVVALSSQGAQLAEGTGIVVSLHRFEQALRGTAAQLTVLRPAYFMESWLPLAGAALATGHLPAFLDPPTRAIDTVSARDVGAIAADALATPQPGVVNIAGPRRYSDADAAAILSNLAGRDIAPAPVPAEHVAAAHEAVGIGASTAAAIAGLYAAINGERIPVGDADRSASGATTLEQVLAAAVA